MKRIRFENFRCFEDASYEFTPGVNLIIGDNASGKTSLLLGCKYALSAFFAGFSDENTKLGGLQGDDFRRIRSVDKRSGDDFPICISFSLGDSLFDPVDDGEGGAFSPTGAEFRLERRSRKNARTLISGMLGLRNYARALKDQYLDTKDPALPQLKALPLFAFYATSDIHLGRKISISSYKEYAQKASFGYSKCMETSGLLDYWIKRWLVLEEDDEASAEVAIVRDSVLRAFGEEGFGVFKDLEVRVQRGEVWISYMDGRVVPLDALSDGYRRLFSIVVDIAFRCALLNRGRWGHEAAKKTRGTVLIDEIDMHLHPRLQSVVVQGLQLAFPSLQFILTTHAPMVMSNCLANGENQVLFLEYSEENGYTHDSIRTHGQDASSIIRNYMGIPPRSRDTEEELQEVFRIIDGRNYSKAKARVEELEVRYKGTLPELQEARSMIYTFEDLLDA